MTDQSIIKDFEDLVEEDVSEQSEALKATAFERESERKCNEKLTQRQLNLDAKTHHPPDSFFKTLDSSVKKNSVFVKKLSSLTEISRHKLEQDLSSLNLTKYIEEVVHAICSAKLKMQDVNCAIHLSSLLHRRYADFSPLLLRTLHNALSNIFKEDKVSRIRIELRLLGQMLVLGIITDQKEGFTLLYNTLHAIVNNDKDKLDFLPAIVSFVKHCGEDIVGVTSTKNRQIKEQYKIEIHQTKILPSEKQQIFYDLLKEYISAVIITLVKLHNKLLKTLKHNKKLLNMKGEVSADKLEAAERLSAQHSKLMMNATTLAEMLDISIPDLPSLQELEDEEECTSPLNPNSEVGGTALWEDDDQKTFYRDIFDLTGIVPQILYKKDKDKAREKEAEKEKEVEKKESKEEDEITEASIEEELEKLTIDEEDEEEDEEEVVTQTTHNKDGKDKDKDSTKDSTTTITISNKAMMEQFMAKLSTISNRDFVNDAAQEFCLKLNTKSNRKKLVRALYGVSRNRLDLLPFHARLVATLSPILPDIPLDLFTLLKKEFIYHLRKKDQSNLETKVKNIRFIGELTKFEMCDKSEALWCFRVLLEQFTHHNIEIACNLVECCGRYLFRSSETHLKTNHLLDQMMRKKAVHNLDTRQITMVENAYYYCNPPDRVAYIKKTRPPIHEYIRKLLIKDLNKHTIEKVLRQFRKLPWYDETVATYAVKCFYRVWNVKYNNIYCVASLLAGLAQFQEKIGILVVDNVVEAIRIGMEINQPHFNQRRIAEAKLLGELYNYRIVESNIIFNTLYLVISFGVLPDGTNPIDPTTDTIRIRIILTILETCGQYFEKGSLKKKCDIFLLFFQKYLFSKVQPLPIDVDYSVQDTLEAIRPNITMYTCVAEVEEAISEIAPQLRSAFVNSEQEEDEEDDTDTEVEESEENEEGEGKVNKKLEVVKCEEDDDFIAELEKTVCGELTGRKLDNMRVTSSDLALPMNRGFKEHRIEGDKMQFSVLLKKGSKQQFKQMDVPLDSTFASNLFDKQKALLKEKEELKRLVLTHEQRQEAEELLAEQQDTRGGVVMRPSERKQKPRKAPQLTTDMFNFNSGK